MRTPFVATGRTGICGITIRCKVTRNRVAKSARWMRERDVHAVIGKRVGCTTFAGRRTVERQRRLVPLLQLAGDFDIAGALMLSMIGDSGKLRLWAIAVVYVKSTEYDSVDAVVPRTTRNNQRILFTRFEIVDGDSLIGVPARIKLIA